MSDPKKADAPAANAAPPKAPMPSANEFLIDVMRAQRNNAFEEAGQLMASLQMKRLEFSRLEVEHATLKAENETLAAKLKVFEDAKEAADKAIGTAAATVAPAATVAAPETASADGGVPAAPEAAAA